MLMSMRTMSWSAVRDRGGACMTLLVRVGFEVKKRSRVFSFLVVTSTTCETDMSLANSNNMFDSFTCFTLGSSLSSFQSMWGRLKSPPIQMFPFPFRFTFLIVSVNSLRYLSSVYGGR